MSASLGRLCLVMLACFTAACERQPQRRTQPLPQQAYVWQRSWTEDVSDSVRRSSGWLEAYHVLTAEISVREGALHVTRVRPHWKALQDSGLLRAALGHGRAESQVDDDRWTRSRWSEELAAAVLEDAYLRRAQMLHLIEVAEAHSGWHSGHLTAAPQTLNQDLENCWLLLRKPRSPIKRRLPRWRGSFTMRRVSKRPRGG